jgi:predicted Ser/Thr protein kinase
MASGDAVEADRFELKDQLGAGANGTVHCVLDRARGEEVALKTLRLHDARALYRFKREFRAAAALTHPNLVRLFELFSFGGEWMFTMERVDGVPFGKWVRPDGALDERRLRNALIQLADGVAALHAAGLLHRDLKPSNVLVEPSGRVVILDFGLIVDPDAVDRTHDRTAVGTPAYMSPEQAADRPLTPATDWYSVGVMLFEALTGRRPFEGSGSQVLAAKQHGTPAPPGAVVPGVPVDLETLCVDLLQRAPGDRPDDEAVLRALGAAPSPWTRRIADQARLDARGFERELAALHDALADSRDHLVHVLVRGPRASGKTALVRAFAEQARDAGAVVLEARNDPREQVPLPGMDRLADALSRYLLSLPLDQAAAVVPPDAEPLGRLFPSLRRVPGLESTAAPTGDPAALAAAMLVAAEILRRIARLHPLVCVVEDIHHSQALGVALTERFFVGPTAPPFLFLYTHDAGMTDTPVLRARQAWTGDLRELTLSARPALRPDT